MNDYIKTIINAIKHWVPVKSVNKKTGDVVLTPSDIGAANDSEVVKKISQVLTDSEKLQVRKNIGVTQADWDQNDNSSSDYIKNRPFYDNSYVVDDPTKMYFTCSGACPIEGRTDTPNYGEADIPELFVVTFDGTPYQVIPVVNEYGVPEYLGDPNYAQYPFYIDIHTDNMQDVYEYRVYSNLSGEHNVVVQPVIQDIKTLDRKFLPEMMSDWSENNPYSPNYVRNRTHWDASIYINMFRDISVKYQGTVVVDGSSFTNYFKVDDILRIYDRNTNQQCETKVHLADDYRLYVRVDDFCEIKLPCIVIDRYDDEYTYSNFEITNLRGWGIFSLDAVVKNIHKLSNEYVDCTDKVDPENTDPVSSRGVYTSLLNSQPNWHVDNKNSINYIDCRPFYDSSDFEVILSTCEFQGKLVHSIESQSREANRFLIVFDGFEYVVDYTTGNWNMNIHTVCDFDKYPFKLEVCDFESVFVTAQDSEIHTVCILSAITVGKVITLADRYIPDSVARVSDIENLVISDTDTEELLGKLDGYVEEETTSE